MNAVFFTGVAVSPVEMKCKCQVVSLWLDFLCK